MPLSLGLTWALAEVQLIARRRVSCRIYYSVSIKYYTCAGSLVVACLGCINLVVVEVGVILNILTGKVMIG